MAGVRDNQGQMVFGLDIGTRSIVGTVGYQANGQFHVLAQRIKEHDTRAMLDGQIHDIGKVGETISVVKKQLEEDLSRSLSEVCIAAAGRVLRTVTTHVEKEFEAEQEIGDEDIYNLSMTGIEQAYDEFQRSEHPDLKFYCVGYTPMRYYMNGYQIGNLAGHKAKTIGCDLIATFLPDDVVDGLYKSVEHAGLHVTNLTLEPIAAIQVAIPEKFRLLNLALVDVGAGTSDISITSDGAIVAYGMIPIAGDSLTNVIVQNCLVDFDMAEHIKRAALEGGNIEFTDIMGLPQTITSEKVLEMLDGAIEQMTDPVAEEIMRLNGDKPVSAVFVVGGGGMIPGYTEKLSKKLGIMKERVAIRGEDVMKNIVFETDARKDSMMVTPIGICLSYYDQSNNFIFITFNDTRLKLYDNGRLSVSDAAIQMEVANEDLFPKRGKALTFTVNGKSRIVRGTAGEAAVITINGDPADLYTQIHSGDNVVFQASTVGEDADVQLSDLPELQNPLHVVINGKAMELPRSADVNKKTEQGFYHIQENDDIVIRNYYTVQEIAKYLDLPLGGEIKVNDTKAVVTTKVYEDFTLELDLTAKGLGFNDLPEDDGSFQEVKDATAARLAKEEAEREAAEQESESAESAEGSAGSSDPQEKSSDEDTVKTTVRQPSTGSGLNANLEITVMVNGAPVTLSGKEEYVFVDIFDFIDFDLNSGKTKIVTLLNGGQAQYMEALHEGDELRIYWDE
ncbi:MAG: rod shape-determining protein [Lachnospiraceae bacterium]|nr:rod shape-determining protein [Lachnospiraceae bacterium]